MNMATQGRVGRIIKAQHPGLFRMISNRQLFLPLILRCQFQDCCFGSFIHLEDALGVVTCIIEVFQLFEFLKPEVRDIPVEVTLVFCNGADYELNFQKNTKDNVRFLA